MVTEEHCKQISLACAHSVLAALGLPPLTVCVLSQFTLLRLRLLCLQLSEVGPGLRVLPRSKPFRFRFRFSGTPQRHRLSWTCVLCPSHVRAAQATRCLTSTVTPRCGVSYHLPHPSRSISWVAAGVPVSGGPCVSSGELISDGDPPGRCQPSRIPRSLG